MSGQSLTSLRDTPQVPLDNIPFDKTQALLELKSSIEFLEKKRVSIQNETERLNFDSIDIKKRLNREIGELKVQRKRLLSQIKSLSSAILQTKDHQDKIIKGMEEFGDEHIAFLNSLSQALQLDIRDSTASLAKKSEDIIQQEDFLSNLASYLEEYARICEATTSQNALERTKIEKMGKEAVSVKQEAHSALKRASNKLSKADFVYNQADEKFKSMDKISRWFEKKADKEDSYLKRLKSDLDIQAKEISAERKDFVAQREALLRRERKIVDKEETLQRAYNEIQAKAKKLGIVI